mmetsp:Transcript_73962/g.186415  ORF Transcript_73962/g.186415 Transcript_73962/m.186415 type:complete len:276 (-) Transcript_73962:1060-1887(-)
MDAILGIDLQPHAAVLVWHILVDLGGAKATLRAIVLRKRHLEWDGSLVVLDLEVRGLVVLVIDTAPDQVLQKLEGVHAIRFGIFDLLAFGGWLRVLAVLLGPLERPRLLASREHQGRGTVSQARDHPRMPCRLEVPDPLQLLPYPRAADALLVGGDLNWCRGLLCKQGTSRGLAREHPCLHGRVAPLDLGHVQEAGATTCDHAAWEGQLRNRLDPPLVQAAGAIGDASAALEQRLHTWMLLKALELLVGAQVWIRVIQANHQSDMHQIVLHVVDE